MDPVGEKRTGKEVSRHDRLHAQKWAALEQALVFESRGVLNLGKLLSARHIHRGKVSQDHHSDSDVDEDTPVSARCSKSLHTTADHEILGRISVVTCFSRHDEVDPRSLVESFNGFHWRSKELVVVEVYTEQPSKYLQDLSIESANACRCKKGSSHVRLVHIGICCNGRLPMRWTHKIGVIAASGESVVCTTAHEVVASARLAKTMHVEVGTILDMMGRQAALKEFVRRVDKP